MDYRNILPLISHTQAFSTDYWNDFGYWNDGTFWYEKTPTYTARVTAYAAATGITDYTILDPLNIFDLGLTYYGLDTIMKALYPMVTDKTSQSDMANQMKYNFMNPLDTNAAFRLQWFGGWTHSSTGALPNGVNAYANTFLTPSTTLLLNSVHLSYYCRTNSITGSIHMGIDSTVPDTYLYQAYNGSVGLISTLNNASLDYINNAVANSLGLSISSRTTSTNVALYKSGVKLKSDIKNSATLPVLNMALGARNASGVISNFDNKQCAFASIGDGLTDFQADIFSTLVNNLQKALNRAVY